MGLQDKIKIIGTIEPGEVTAETAGQLRALFSAYANEHPTWDVEGIGWMGDGVGYVLIDADGNPHYQICGRMQELHECSCLKIFPDDYWDADADACLECADKQAKNAEDYQRTMRNEFNGSR